MSTAKPRVLIVDDNEVDRQRCQRYLEQDEQVAFDIVEAATSTEAIEVCRNSSPDCVLLDYKLPDSDGLSVLQQLNSGVDFVAPTVIMVTGFGDEQVAVEAMKRGALDYLVKEGLTPALLFRAVNNAIEKGNMRRKIAQQQGQLEQQHVEIKQANDQLVEQNSRLKQSQRALLNMMQDLESATQARRDADEDATASAKNLSDVRTAIAAIALTEAEEIPQAVCGHLLRLTSARKTRATFCDNLDWTQSTGCEQTGIQANRFQAAGPDGGVLKEILADCDDHTAVVIDDPASDERLTALSEIPDSPWAICPVKNGEGQLVGSLEISGPAAGAFQKEDTILLEIIALVAVARCRVLATS